MEQRDVAPIATTSTSSPILPVGLRDAFTGEFESVSAETAGPATTHPELTPVGGRGILGSADSPLVGVSTLGYPSEHADPSDNAFSGLASSAEVMTTADTTTTESTTSTAEITSRQPPTVAEVTAAASRSPTLMYHHRVSPCRQHCLHNAL